MTDRRVSTLRVHGFVLLLLALIQGFLIAAAVGTPQAQGRAHIELLLLSLLILAMAAHAPSFRLSERQQQALVIATLVSAWLGAVHTVAVATLGATSIHVQPGTAHPVVEKLLLAIGGLSAPFGLVGIGLAVAGAISHRRSLR